MRRNAVEEVVNECSEPSILDRLKSAKAKLATAHARKMGDLNAKIRELEDSDAEGIVASAKEVLDRVG